MGATYVVSSHRPFTFGEYRAFPGDVVHEAWLDAEALGQAARLVRLGILAPGPKVKDSPPVPDELRRTDLAVEEEAAPEPEVEPEPEPVTPSTRHPTRPRRQPSSP